ncbi:G-type lectin S-receptor-like serine/threonine-protein kinase At2g19130 [Morus notabilis]|uniref:G-type lectin S-receptor-like serine/threonine-protein kinase At2g19130 n=1 Tax=Morus notabilis TaxID=981085 RepID=UPI000CED0DF9|nr:G-type lectin S-receptor-like serine/threonine-protein kinase At2g19130 [Morus notabilis]
MDMKTNPRFMFVLLFVCLFLETNLSLRVDTISANQSLSGHQTIVSAGGVFELGFFKPGNSPNYYIGMWWKKVTVQTVVWVANREKPVLDRFSSELKISNGNLVLFNGSKVPIWSTNVNSTRSASLEAVLLDNGNLVLKHVGKQMKPIWESFYHLTDSLLPGCKFGYNKKTKRKQVLTAWKNLEDPAPGRYSIEPFPRDNSFVIEWNMSRGFWNTGTWNGEIFNLVPGVNIHSLYNFSYVSNDKESYFIYFVENTTKTISRLVMGISGQLQQPLWMPPEGWRTIWSFPRQQCKVHAFCGPYGSCTDSANVCSCLTGFKQKSPSDSDLKDYSGGCIRKTKLQCENYNISSGEKDKFLELPDMLLHESEQFVKVGDITACESTCLNNCSCVAFAYDNKHGCSIWTNDLLDLEQLKAGDNNGRTLYLRLAASDYWDAMNSKRLIRSASNKALIIGVVVGSSVVLLAGLVIFSVIRQRNKKIRRQKEVQNSLTVFTYKELQNATKNFSEKLGGGGFGSVFKGTLPHSSMVAVKKLESVGQGEKQFRAEVSTIGTIQHVNLVRLRGFCSEGTKKLLVYDYMQNGSLGSRLFHEKNSNVLEWKARYQIALGTARGLVYLHEMCRNCIIHCDIKPENILLDAEFSPKVADFGLAKLVGREFSRVLTTMRGTRGYLAPEWLGGLAITPKADVYSYGMMLFELVSGKRNSKQSDSEGKVPKYFPSLATSVVVEGGDVLSILDPRLEGDADVQELENVCKVACWCIQDEEAHRPTMSQVVQMLEGTLEVDLPPIPRTLYFFDEN